MPEQAMELPADLQDKLPADAVNIFKAAMKSAQDDGLSEQAAMDVAWNTIKHDFRQDEHGNWHRKPDDTNQTYKGVQSGGN